MPVRDFPPPPPLDRDYPMNGYVGRGREIAELVVCGVIIALFFGAIWIFEGEEGKRTSFLSRCIEFQTLDRCEQLYRFRRQDLMERR